MAFPTRLTIATLTDQYIQLDGVADGLTQAPISNATVTVTLTDYNGTTVATMANINMAAVTGLAGSYRGLVTNTFNPPVGTEYTATFNVTSGAFKRPISLPVTVAKG